MDSNRADFAERIESLKAGCTGATAVSLAFGLELLFNHWLVLQPWTEFAPLPTTLIGFQALSSGAIAAFAGFLFGITYRYVVRADQNPHLQSGVVLAFGLVRGLAQVDVALTVQGVSWMLAVLAAESLFLFAIARFSLELALQQGWIKPFSSP